MTRQELDQFIDGRIKPNSANEITAAKHNAVDKALADYAEDYSDAKTTQEASARDTAIASAISSEASARNAAIASAIAGEITARDTAISTAVAGEASARTSAIAAAIASEVTARNAAIADAVLQARITRYSAFGGSYDAASGTWRMHAVGGQYLVTGLSAADMELICATPNMNAATKLSGALRNGAKTNLPIDVYGMIRTAQNPVDIRDMARDNKSFEMFYVPVSGTNTFYVSANGMANAFYGCTALRVVKYLDVSKCTSTVAFNNTFYGCAALEECYLKGLNASLDLGDASNLTQASLIYLVENAGTASKTLTVTGRITGTNWSPTDSYPTWEAFETLCQSKNITLQTT